MQFSARMLDGNVFPHLSSLSRCGAPLLKRGANHFASFMYLSTLGGRRFKRHIHALLTVFFRRVDFACATYRQGRSRLLKYTRKLPMDNSQTRQVRLSMGYFESCILHLTAALRCLDAILESLGQKNPTDNRVKRLNGLSNRVRHFDEDVFKNGKIGNGFGIAPIWIDDTGLRSQKHILLFSELVGLLNEATSECAEFNKMLSEPAP